MAHLTDMEELLASIGPIAIREYMREAMNCYMASAYRGCIVLSYIALFDDLLAKLGELGKVNAHAKTIFDEASKKKSDQEVFESYLIDQLGAKNLLSGLDTAFLSTLRVLRNKSAHPSGHTPSAEEARFIFHEVISRFLSKPILSTTQLVDELVARLANTIFFPSALIGDVKNVVEEELSLLHVEAIPQLVSKMAEAIAATDPTISKNAGFFLSGLASINDTSINKQLQKKVLQTKADDPKYSLIVLRLLSSNGSLINGVTLACLSRVKQVISDQIDAVKASLSETRFSHPVAVFVSLSKALDEPAFTDTFSTELKKLFDKRPYSEYLLSALSNHPKSLKLYFSAILDKAGSSTFDTANAFAHAAEKIDEKLAALISDEQAFSLAVAVLSAASWGAFGAKGLKETKFAATPEIRAKAVAYVKGSKTKAKALVKEKLSLEIKTAEFITEYFGEVEAA